jgi:hypothetical protein
MALAQGVTFKVSGLRAIAARARQFQKIILLLQTVSANPALAQVFDQRFSFQKVLMQMVKALDIDPTAIDKDPGAGLELDPRLLMGGNQGQVPGGTGGPESQLESNFAAANQGGARGPTGLAG